MNPNLKSLSSENYEVLILAPVGGDAEAAAEILRKDKIRAQPFKTLSDLCERLKAPAGAVLIAEEAFTRENARDLQTSLAHHEAWSNLPIILMTSQKERIFSTEEILDVIRLSGSVSILERPFRILTFLAAVRVALQARQKQYQVGDLLEEQRKAVKQQEFAVQQRDDFLSIASHELKTPITSLKIQVQMRKRFLRRGDTSVFSPEKVTALIEATETQVERLSRLVDDMLDISRIVNGKLTLGCEQIELGKVTREVMENFSSQFHVAGCTTDLQIEARVFGFWDPYRLEQVIANLFTNAIKYGAGKPINVTVKSKNDHAILSVTDHGMGIAVENQERIFQRFERAVRGNSISGLGLGLFIVREILNLHHGTIHVESVLGQGSTFIIELPANAGKVAYATGT